MTIGEKIKTIRVKKGITQAELERRTGIKAPNIRKYEVGKLNPKPDTLNKIANALCVSVYEFIPENDPKDWWGR